MIFRLLYYIITYSFWADEQASSFLLPPPLPPPPTLSLYTGVNIVLFQDIKFTTSVKFNLYHSQGLHARLQKKTHLLAWFGYTMLYISKVKEVTKDKKIQNKLRIFFFFFWTWRFIWEIWGSRTKRQHYQFA